MILYITSGQKVKSGNGQLIVEVEGITTKVVCKDIDAVILDSLHCSITTGAHLCCSEHSIPVIICNNKHEPQVICYNLYGYHKLSHTLGEQIAWKATDKKLVFSYILRSKLLHQAQLLEFIKSEVAIIENIRHLSNQIIETGSDMDGLEAVAARIYFRELFGRNFIRFASDTLNAALNYGYSLLRSVIKNQIVSKGLHPSLGLWHHSSRNNFNLADDFIQLFRPMVDYAVFHYVDPTSVFSKEHRHKLMLTIL